MESYTLMMMLLLAGLLCLWSPSFGARLPQDIPDDEDIFATIDQKMLNAEKLSQPSSNPFYFTEHTNLIRTELDIVQTVEEYMETKLMNRQKRTAAVRPSKKTQRWPNGEVNYELESGPFDSRDYQEIEKAMKEISHYTCLKFRETKSEKNRVFLQLGFGGCYSHVGMIGGAQALGLSKGCRMKQIIIHELLHAIGMHHEQTRPDRDDYITVKLENIYDHVEYNFKKHGWDYINTYNITYDYSSVMHYGKTAFSANGEVTMLTKDPRYADIIGTNPGLSLGDIRTLNHMYSCVPDSCNLTNADCGENGFVGKDCKCWCPGSKRHIPVEYCFDDDKEAEGTLDIVHECIDYTTQCPQLASDGYCKEAPLWTMYYCEKSCGYC